MNVSMLEYQVRVGEQIKTECDQKTAMLLLYEQDLIRSLEGFSHEMSLRRVGLGKPSGPVKALSRVLFSVTKMSSLLDVHLSDLSRLSLGEDAEETSRAQS